MNISMNPNSELVQFFVKVPDMVQVPDILSTQAYQFQEAMMMYTCAIREAKTKLEVLSDELSVRDKHNPIEMIKSRVRKPLNIAEKLQRRGLNTTVQSMMDSLDDIAGIRVTCFFVDDIYQMVEILARQDDVWVVAIKGYIKNPKDNDYRSHHMIIEIPVFFFNEKKLIRVGAQIRMIATDFWASSDHQLKYKKELANMAKISEELRRCAGVIVQTDQEVLSIRKRIEFREVARETASMSI